MTVADDALAVVQAVRELEPRVRAAAEPAESARRLPPDLIAALAATGVFRLCVPRALGGAESDPRRLVEAIETVASADGSAGWCVMIGTTSGVISAYLPVDEAAAIYADPRLVTGGVFAPSGKAVAVDRGFQVSGHWAFASGCEHCQWLMGGCVVFDGDTPRLLPGGAPDTRLMMFPASAARVLDTWNVSGLRATGSHDIAVSELHVPAARAVSLITDRPRYPGPLFAFPVFGLLALGIAAVALGIARRAIAELIALAGAKTPQGSRRRLNERAMIQVGVAQADATVRAARALLFAALEESWQGATTAGRISMDQRGRLRQAATHATWSAAQAVDLMYNAGGGTSIYATSPLQRCLRDVHVVTQHMMVAPATWELIGRLLLGLESDTTML
jgi:alkylation response protein AidB-like acyl-CoA dehydrogenase